MFYIMLSFFYNNKGWLLIDWIFHENAWLTYFNLILWFYTISFITSISISLLLFIGTLEIVIQITLTTAAPPFLNNEKADNFNDVTETSTNACKALLSYNFSEQFYCELGLHFAGKAALTHGEHSFRSTLPQALLSSPRSLTFQASSWISSGDD